MFMVAEFMKKTESKDGVWVQGKYLLIDELNLLEEEKAKAIQQIGIRGVRGKGKGGIFKYLYGRERT